MKNMKNRISFLLVLVMLFAMLAVPANAVTVEGEKAIVSVEEVEEAIKASNGDTIELDFSNVSELITAVEVPAAAIEKVEATDKTLTINTGIASLVINQAALTGIVNQIDSTGNVTLALMLFPVLNVEQMLVMDQMMGWFETDILYGEKTLEVGEGGSITVIIPEDLVGAVGGDSYSVAKLDENGKFHVVETKSIDGNLVAELTELAVYALIEKAAPVNPFVDVKESDWFYNSVLWAVENGITSGIDATHFGPNTNCTRAQVVTFLYAAAGRPNVTATEEPFDDVKETDWFYEPVLWAVENGITNGIDATHFGPNKICTRAAVVTFLYAMEGKPEITAKSEFVDVAETDWFAKPVLWAVENKVTNGIGGGKFGPNSNCTRAAIVTFLKAAK